MAHLLLAPTGWIATGVLLFAACGVARLARAGRTGDGAPSLVATVVMLVFAVFGTHVPGINQLEPGRLFNRDCGLGGDCLTRRGGRQAGGRQPHTALFFGRDELSAGVDEPDRLPSPAHVQHEQGKGKVGMDQ